MLAPVGEAGPEGRDERRERHEQYEYANPSHGSNPLSAVGPARRAGLSTSTSRAFACRIGQAPQNRKSCSASAARR